MTSFDSGIGSASYAGVADVPYHRQDQDFYCGAAVAQTLLRTIDGVLDDQEQLMSEIAGNQPAGGGGTTPGGLVKTLMERRTRYTFEARACATIDDALQQIVPVVSRGVEVPLMVVEDGASHWITVTGVQLADGAVAGFYVNDPYPGGTQTPMQHFDEDSCGDGKPSDGVKNVFWTAHGFSFAYKPDDSGFTAVLASPAAEISHVAQVSGARQAPLSQSSPPDGWQDALTNAINFAGLLGNGAPLAAFLTGFTVGDWNPVGSPGVFQVTLHSGTTDAIAGNAYIDANAALMYLRASANEYAPASTVPDDVRRMLHRDAAVVEKLVPGILRDLDHTGVRADLMWRRCREAPLPFEPLLRMRIGTSTLYRSSGGRYHTRLHRARP